LPLPVARKCTFGQPVFERGGQVGGVGSGVGVAFGVGVGLGSVSVGSGTQQRRSAAARAPCVSVVAASAECFMAAADDRARGTRMPWRTRCTHRPSSRRLGTERATRDAAREPRWRSGIVIAPPRLAVARSCIPRVDDRDAPLGTHRPSSRRLGTERDRAQTPGVRRHRVPRSRASSPLRRASELRRSRRPAGRTDQARPHRMKRGSGRSRRAPAPSPPSPPSRPSGDELALLRSPIRLSEPTESRSCCAPLGTRRFALGPREHEVRRSAFDS
jgi:hypothetical protein